MPNSLDGNGIQVKTRAELVAELTADFQGIYGANVDLSPSSPDGQLLNIFVQSILDVQDDVVKTYNSFDPDNAVGIQLDQRVAINGIQRQGGTYTITPITITVDRALNLFGLDQTAQPVFTVADAAGNQWLLLATQAVGGAGSYSYQFRAANPGRVVTIPNTITIQVTIVLGVSAVNNPSLYSTLGVDEELDALLRVRRQKSVTLPSQGFVDGLTAALGNVVGVTYVKVYENVTDAFDSDDVPPHAIWVVIAGTPAAADVANAIYVNRTEGCNQRGLVTFVVTQKDGSPFVIRWDVVTPQTLYCEFTATSIDGINPPKVQQILTDLPIIFVPGIGQEVDITALGAAVQRIDPNTLVTDAGFSASPSGPFTATLNPTAKNYQLVLLTQNIYVLPVVMLPVTASVPRTLTQQFNAYGGSQTGYTYSLTVNESGGSIDSGTGLYTAGASVGADTVRVIDSDGNEAFSTVSVI